MAEVIFNDYSVQVKAAIEDAALRFLEEAASEFEAQAARRTPVDSSKLKGAWKHVVDESELEAVVGNTEEYSIYVELGTGEYAVDGMGGEPGYWVFVKDSDGTYGKHVSKRYTLDEAKRIMAYLRAQGLEAYYTKGQKPRRMLHDAFVENKNKVERRAQQIFREELK